MKTLHSFALYALVTPVLTLGTGSVLAQQSAGQDTDREQHSEQRDHDATKSTPRSAQGDESKQRARHSDAQQAGEYGDTREQSRSEHRGYLDAAPADGMQASNLIGANVITHGDENVGSVDDLIIDQDGQVVAIVVGVGGFLGIGERDVAIGWDDVTRSGDADEQELRVDVTREDLRSAPDFEKRD